MAEVLHLPDGSTKICFGGEEFALGELIEEKLGLDAKDIYDHVIAGRNEAVTAYEELLDSQEDDDDDSSSFSSTPIFKTLCEEIDKTHSSGGFDEDAMK